MERILIATDGSEGSIVALQQGLGLARETGADAVLLYVRQRPHSVLGQPIYQHAVTEETAIAERALGEAKAIADELGVPAETEAVEGEPAEQIVRLAQLRDVDMIVVGSRRLGALAGALLGSVSRAVIRAADCPVLVAKHSLARKSRVPQRV